MSEDHFKLPGKANQPEPSSRLDKRPAPEGTVWLRNWKGRKCKTKKSVLAARCQACGHSYSLTGEATNRRASEAGALAKADRGWTGLTMIVGGWDTGVQTKNAGKQLRAERADKAFDRLVGERNAAYWALCCPSCRSDQVLIEAPRD